MFKIFQGLAGSVIDSILGALFQYSGQDVETRLIVSEAGDGVRIVFINFICFFTCDLCIY